MEVWPRIPVPEEEWSKESCITIPKEIDQSERRKAQPVFQVAKSQASEVIPCKKFSSWRKLVRVTAYVLRFINKLRNKVRKQENAETTEAKDTSEVVPISAKELEDAEWYWIKQSQKSLHARLKKGELKGLTPFIDENGVIRVGGRVNEAIIIECKLKLRSSLCQIYRKRIWSHSHRPFIARHAIILVLTTLKSDETRLPSIMGSYLPV